MPRYARSSSDTAPPSLTPSTPPTTLTHSTKPTSGATSPHFERPPHRADGAAHARRGVVVRATGHRTSPRRGAVTRRRDPAPASSADRAVHHDDQGPGQRSRARAGRGS